MVSPKKSRSRRANGPHSIKSRQNVPSGIRMQPLVPQGNLPVSSQDQPSPERVKRRRYSASPGPVTPTRLRSRIKETERGQHLANASEHRRLIHEQSLESQAAGKAKEESIPPTIAPAPPLPPQVMAPSIPIGFEGPLPYGDDSLYHPKLGWFPFPVPLDISTKHTQQPGSRVSQTPGYVPPGDSTRTVPYEDLLGASSRQGAPDVPTEHTQQPGS
ncbi:hypothetical protein CVT26_011808, partial [Gymnopilus dilepis]